MTGITLISQLIRDLRIAAKMATDDGNDPYIEVDGVQVGHCKVLAEVGITSPTTKTVVFGYN